MSWQELCLLAEQRQPRAKRQTPGEWARQHGRAGQVMPWSVYDGSMRLWWAHAHGYPDRQAALLQIARDWWWDKGGSVSRLATSGIEWERELARVLVLELDPMFGGWNGVIWREGTKLVIWREATGRIETSSVSPILGPEETPPHGTHVRGALGCDCTSCQLALQVTRKIKREPGRPKGKIK